MCSKNFIIGLKIKCFTIRNIEQYFDYLKIHFITLVVNQYYFKTVLNMLNVTCFFHIFYSVYYLLFKTLKSEMTVNKECIGNYCNHNMLKTKCSIFTVLNTSDPRDNF